MAATSSGSSAGATESGTAVNTGFGGAAATTASNDGATAQAFVLGLGRVYGLGIVLASVFAGFTFML